jgi:hypothetical protein
MAIGTGLGTLSAFVLYQWFLSDPVTLAFFAALFRLSGVVGAEVLAIPLGFVLGVVIEFVLMMIAFRRVFSASWRPLLRPVVVAFCAAVAGGITTYGVLNFVVEGVNQATFIGVLLQGASAFVAGVTVIIATYFVFRSPELSEVYRSIKARLIRSEVVAPQADVL